MEMHTRLSSGVRCGALAHGIGLAAGGLLLVALAAPAVAQTPVTLPQTLTNGGASWDIVNTGGTSNGRPTGGTCDNSPGLAVLDAQLLAPSKVDAFDYGLTLWVNDNIVVPGPGTLTRSGQTLSAGPSPLNGLNVTVQYAALAGSPTLRVLLGLQNPTSSPLTRTVSLVSNLGSDATTVVTATSSGDTTFTTADRWVITADSAAAPGDPVVTHVLAGPGSPTVPPAAVSQTVFGCLAPPFTQGVLASYSLTVPPGATRYLLVFAQLAATTSGAASAAAAFDTTPLPGNDLVSGLDAAVLRNVVNWDYSALGPPDTPTTPTPAPSPTSRGVLLPPAAPPLPLAGGPLLVPPPAPLPPPPAPARMVPASAPPVAAEVPVIPEADSHWLLGLGLAASLAAWALRARRSTQTEEHDA
jgi:hypothetical protein